MDMDTAPTEIIHVEPKAEPKAQPSLRDIFSCFFVIGSQSFGGGTSAWIRREVVTKRGWLDDKQFLSSLAVCQIAPGPNPMNMAVFLGSMMRGTIGALTAFAGLMVFPVVLCLVLGTLYFAGRHLAAFGFLLSGLGAVAIGMNIANATRLTQKNVRHLRQVIVIGLVTIAVGFCRFPLLYVLAVAVPINVFAEIWCPA
jgi:chromate transporter